MRSLKIRLGYTNYYVSGDEIDEYKHRAEDFVKEKSIRCSYCGCKLRKGDWISILHTPGDTAKPQRLHFFCLSKHCHFEWGLQSQEHREG
ncbi:MAG TPA: hypothetical protein ENL16_02160 [Candidatus Woesearchaeota archaeon]|nr:hypothetical protein [Candidatus Woesearchaeota archaeon]